MSLSFSKTSMNSSVTSKIGLPPVPGARADQGTKERWVHSGRVFVPACDEAGTLLARVIDEDVLDQLLLAGSIRRAHRAAGWRLRTDFQDAGMGAHLVGSYSPVRCAFSIYGGGDERSDAQEAAHARWRRAVEAMGRPYAGVVVSAVCYEDSIGARQEAFLIGGLIKLARWYRALDGARTNA